MILFVLKSSISFSMLYNDVAITMTCIIKPMTIVIVIYNIISLLLNIEEIKNKKY